MEFAVIVHKGEDRGYWAEVPDLPGCYTQGDDMEELESNLREAIALMLDLPDPEPAREPQCGWSGSYENRRLGDLTAVTV